MAADTIEAAPDTLVPDAPELSPLADETDGFPTEETVGDELRSETEPTDDPLAALDSLDDETLAENARVKKLVESATYRAEQSARDKAKSEAERAAQEAAYRQSQTLAQQQVQGAMRNAVKTVAQRAFEDAERTGKFEIPDAALQYIEERALEASRHIASEQVFGIAPALLTQWWPDYRPPAELVQTLEAARLARNLPQAAETVARMIFDAYDQKTAPALKAQLTEQIRRELQEEMNAKSERAGRQQALSKAAPTAINGSPARAEAAARAILENPKASRAAKLKAYEQLHEMPFPS